MEITVIKIGKPALDLQSHIETYSKRLSSFTDFKILEWKEDKPEAIESKLEKILKPSHKLVLLDERGKMFDSKSFSKQIGNWIDDPGVKGLVFVIGGPFGFSDSTRKKAGALIALSSLTFQGDIAWLVLVEQIYRAFTILKNIDYHH